MTERAPEASVILVVEDDDLVRMNAAEMLEDAGFTVVEARHADEARLILHERSGIGVVFTDVDMPGSMCGVTLTERVYENWTDIRLVLTSGRHRFADRAVPDHGLFVPPLFSANEPHRAAGISTHFARSLRLVEKGTSVSESGSLVPPNTAGV